MANLLRLIQKMHPKQKKKQAKIAKKENLPKDDKEMKKHLFPGLSKPDDPKIRVCAS